MLFLPSKEITVLHKSQGKISNFLNNHKIIVFILRFFHFAEIIASSVVGQNWTFFVPSDDAFDKYGFDQLPDTTISSKKFINMILNHFVKGRLYDRDLKNGEAFETVGGKTLKITRDSSDHVFVNRVVSSLPFVVQS